MAGPTVPTNRKNSTDKDQSDIERAADNSAIRFHHFNKDDMRGGTTKSIGAYDMQAQGNTGGTSSSVMRQFTNQDGTDKTGKVATGGVIGSHNDKPHLSQQDLIGRKG